MHLLFISNEVGHNKNSPKWKSHRHSKAPIPSRKTQLKQQWEIKRREKEKFLNKSLLEGFMEEKTDIKKKANQLIFQGKYKLWFAKKKEKGKDKEFCISEERK